MSHHIFHPATRFSRIAVCLAFALTVAACGSDNGTAGPPNVATGTVVEQIAIPNAPPTRVEVGSLYRYIPLPSGASARMLSYDIVNMPSWASFARTTGELSGTPAATDAGVTGDIQIGVTNGTQRTSIGPFRINVIPTASHGDATPTPVPLPTPVPPNPTPPPSPAPSLTIAGTPATKVAAGAAYSFTPAAGGSAGSKPVFSVLNAPSWTNFSASTGQLAGSPGTGEVGTYANILITVSNGKQSASLPAFTIQVTPASSGTPAQALLTYMKGLTGKGILSGQYANYLVPGMMNQVPLITNGTGETPAILGTFLSLESYTSNADPIALSNQWLAKGGIVLMMLSPGNPTYSSTIFGGITQSTKQLHGHPVNFNNILIPGTIEYTRWQAFLAQLVTSFKAINGPVIVRPFPELNSDLKWWGQQPPAQFIAVWQQMVNYVRNAGVTNVLWCLNFGAHAIPQGFTGFGNVVKAYYPGDAYVDIVSLDSYPPSPDNAPAVAALTETGKPVIYAEIGSVAGQVPVQEFSGNTGSALAAIVANFPQVVAAVVWSGTEALPAQNGMDTYMSNPKLINLSHLPANL